MIMIQNDTDTDRKNTYFRRPYDNIRDIYVYYIIYILYYIYILYIYVISDGLKQLKNSV